MGMTSRRAAGHPHTHLRQDAKILYLFRNQHNPLLNMTFPSGVNYDLIKTISTVLFPGTIAISPYLWVAQSKWPDLASKACRHEGLTFIILLILIVGVGMLMEDFGSEVEGRSLDKWGKPQDHFTQWEKFLALAFKKDEEPTGHRYIRTIVARLKFELGAFCGILVAIPGFIWGCSLNPNAFSCSGLAGILASLIAIEVILLFEAWSSSEILARTRRIILAKYKK